jgi:hypothetical protein
VGDETDAILRRLEKLERQNRQLKLAGAAPGKRKVLYFLDGAPGSASIRGARIPRRGAGAVEQGCLLSSYPA